MYYIKTEESFDSAHFLAGYEGKCHNLHGHRWRVVATVCGDSLSEEKQTHSMLYDFKDIKASLRDICDELDHCMIYEKGSLKPATVEALKSEGFRLVELEFRPTAEKIAEYIYGRLEEEEYTLHRVEVYETPNNCAIYEGS